MSTTRQRGWLLAGGIAVLLGAMVAAAFVAFRPGGERAAATPLAVVLVPDIEGSRLVAVDPDSGKVVATTRLRSLATDIEADGARGAVVAAQTGGVAGTADDALSIADPRTGEVAYMKLPTIDPSQVECVSGRAIVLHAVIDRAGFAVSGIDLATRTVVGIGRAPDGTGLWAAASGALWTAVATDGPIPYSLLRIDPSTLSTSAGPALGFAPAGITDSGDRALAFGVAREGETPRARLALLDGRTSAVTATAALRGLPHGAQIATTVGDLVVVGDWNGDMPETGSLEVVERSTLRRLRTIDLGGAPCALAAYGDHVLVVDRVSGTLLKVDPSTGAVEWCTPLGSRDLVCSKVVVITRVGPIDTGAQA